MTDREDMNELPVFRSTRPIPDPTELTNQLVEKAIMNLREIIEMRIDGIENRIESSEAVTVRQGEDSYKNLHEMMEMRYVTINEASISRQDTVMKQLQSLTETVSIMSKNINERFYQNDTQNERSSAVQRQMHDEKIKSIIDALHDFKVTVNSRFELADIQTEKAAHSVKSAVDASFAAAKEAVSEQNRSNAVGVAKSEITTTKQIDQLTENLRLSVRNTDDKIDALNKASDGKFTDLKDRLVAMEATSRIADPATSHALREMSSALTGLKTGADTNSGRNEGSNNVISFIVAGAAIVYSIVATVMLLARVSGKI